MQQTNFTHPDQIQNLQDAMHSLVKLLLESSKTLSTLRREFRGEALAQYEDGKQNWIQVCKPLFTKTDPRTGEPLKIKVTYPGENEQEIYVVHDEAIEEILSMLKFAGINQITHITNIKEDIILDDLKEFECKLAATLMLKRKAWGIDKAMLPMIQFKIKTLVQDARYMARQGTILNALQRSVQRVEQVIEGDRSIKKRSLNPYGN